MILPYDCDQPKRAISPTTHGLVLANVLVSLLVFSGSHRDATLIAWSFGRDSGLTPLRWLSSIFLHADLFHLLGNMWALHLVGRALEFRLGSLRLLGLYLAGGLVASLAQTVASPLPQIGASGAVAALFGAYVYIMPWARIFAYSYGWLWFRHWLVDEDGTVGAFFLLLYWGAGQILALSLHGQASGIAYVAHLGGVAAGLGLAALAVKLRALAVADPVARPSAPLPRRERLDLSPDARRAAARARAEDEAHARVQASRSARERLERALGGGEPNEAVRVYEQAHLLGERPVLAPTPQEVLARALVTAGRRRLAIKALEDLAATHPGTPEARRAAGALDDLAARPRAA